MQLELYSSTGHTVSLSGRVHVLVGAGADRAQVLDAYADTQPYSAARPVSVWRRVQRPKCSFDTELSSNCALWSNNSSNASSLVML
jgi:hypothetical protein